MCKIFCTSIRKTIQLMLLTKLISAYSENDTKYVSTLCECSTCHLIITGLMDLDHRPEF
jgi:hypothetical protein